MKHNKMVILIAAAAVLFSAFAGAQDTLDDGKEYIFTQGLAAGPMGKYGRAAVHSDPLEYLLITGDMSRPKEGGDAADEKTWEKIASGSGDWFGSDALRGGYFYAFVYSDDEQVMLLEAAGHSMVFVNGVPRGGDVYGYGWIQHPVQLVKGRNEFLFRVSRGRVKAKLTPPESPVMLAVRDTTLPDLVVGRSKSQMGAVCVINATRETVDDLVIFAKLDIAEGEVVRDLPVTLGPMTTRKVGFVIHGPAPDEPGKVKATVTLARSDGVSFEALDTAELELNVRAADGHYKETFTSAIDGSVQYFAVSPGHIEGEAKPGLVLTLHGASVEAWNQARVYKHKPWCHVVAPSNRRPYGFDWEDWGRLDALEVFGIVKVHFQPDPKRIYLTGHSMGGHGAWYLGAVHPSMFAAIAPSAGWYSFFSYGGKERDRGESAMEELYARASNPSDTLALSRNYLHHGVYILHGDQDDNVPVDQARFMLDHLSKFHKDFAYYERPGAGHWWGGECCDWPSLFAFLEHHEIPENRDVETVEFHTANPGISSKSRWVGIQQQIHPLKISSVTIKQDVKARSFTGTTENVALLTLDLDQLEEGGEVMVRLDGEKQLIIKTQESEEPLWLAQKNGEWVQAEALKPNEKGPHRYGTFKDAFRHGVMLLYSTRGTEEENTWSYDRARFDAETFWYRGNASMDVLPDTAFDPELHSDRSVIVYGNADTHAAWAYLLGESPMQVARGKMAVGERKLDGEDLGCFFIRPRPDSDIASVGVVSGTGLVGMKAANMNLYFIAGSGYPDVLIFGADMLKNRLEGVRCIGYFGNDWSVEHGDFAFAD